METTTLTPEVVEVPAVALDLASRDAFLQALFGMHNAFATILTRFTGPLIKTLQASPEAKAPVVHLSLAEWLLRAGAPVAQTFFGLMSCAEAAQLDPEKFDAAIKERSQPAPEMKVLGPDGRPARTGLIIPG
jgi:hypothetical protein